MLNIQSIHLQNYFEKLFPQFYKQTTLLQVSLKVHMKK